VVVQLPDIRGREQILNVHMRKVPIGPDVKADVLARGTPGMSGADLANLVNEAALFAARRAARLVEMIDFERAKDKILMGAERRSMIMDEDERKSTAYHESGHALLGRLLPKADPVHKVTIIPRGRALGVTMSLPEKDRYSYDRTYILSKIAMLFGGRIAEEIFINEMTTGASNDFERATQMARDMVTRYGMSDLLGPMVYAENEGEVFLGRSITKTTNVSEETMRKVDQEIRRIIDEQYALARKLIEENADKMHTMAKALLDWETIGIEQLDDIMAGRPPRPPKDLSPPSAGRGPSSPPAPRSYLASLQRRSSDRLSRAARRCRHSQRVPQGTLFRPRMSCRSRSGAAASFCRWIAPWSWGSSTSPQTRSPMGGGFWIRNAQSPPPVPS
jgi:cell division protease FtsH